MEFEAACFINEKEDLKKKWEPDEDEILQKIIEESDDNPKWNDVAIDLFMRSNKKFFRLGKHCRERWLNHLNTKISHDKWTEEEDQALIRGILSCGQKWSKITKMIGNHRTEHMIKNRFISLVLRYKKAHPYIYGEEDALNGIAA